MFFSKACKIMSSQFVVIYAKMEMRLHTLAGGLLCLLGEVYPHVNVCLVAPKNRVRFFVHQKRSLKK